MEREPVKLRTVPRALDADPQTEGTATRAWLPADLLEKAADRTAVFAFVVGGAVAVLAGFANLRRAIRGVPLEALPIALAAAAIAVSFAVGLAIRRRVVSPGQAPTLGRVYFVLIAFAISLAETSYPKPSEPELRGISWVCVLTTLFPLIVPGSPRRTAIAAFAAAATGPVALAIHVAAGTIAPAPLPAYVTVGVSNIACAVLAILPARILAELGAEVRRERRMGSYILERLLGKGAMGEVWRARHAHLIRKAAIKLIRPEAIAAGAGRATATVVERFKREAQATASLQSAHTVELYDFGVTEEGTFFYVMELLDGVDLRELVHRFGAQPPERVVRILRQACHSLADAHAAGLIHRDIKHSNIYLCRVGLDVDFVKVLDFGLVRSVRDRESHAGPADAEATGRDAELTREGVIAGTPAFMAPEQARGARDVDGRADLYALGAVGYFLVTGELPFKGTPAEVLLHQVGTKPVPPSRVAKGPCPPDLEDVILRCLEKRPEDRPQSAEALNGLLAAVKTPAPWTRERAERWWTEHLPPAAREAPPPVPPASPSADAATLTARPM